MTTRREQLVQHLTGGEHTPRDLATLMRLPIRDLLDDLEHVRRSYLGSFTIKPAVCRSCGFIFAQRSKMGTPSRCPTCKSERIAGPWLRIHAD
jgi:predicted Zn-ribbon and HTH transcriptional regulator